MRLCELRLRNFCGYRDSTLRFGEFACLYGPNGIGKTTILNAVSLLTSSLDFGGDIDGQPDREDKWTPRATAEQRCRAYLQKNIMFFGEPDGASEFFAAATFEHNGHAYEVELTQDGISRNEIIDKDWWWNGITYFARFDSDLVNFQLRYDLWETFASAYEGITGISVEPEVMVDTDLEDLGEDGRIVTGFFLRKAGSRIHSKRASAGEKKIAKSLSQVVNLEPSRLPCIVLVDNMEMHVHYKRHLRMFEEVKKLFCGMQVITTTHSAAVIEQYEPRKHLFNVEAIILRRETVMERPQPLRVDAEKFASEVKFFLNAKKEDLVDNSDPRAAIESWPDPDDEDYPEMKRVATAWAGLFDYADEITDDDGVGFPDDMVKQYEEEVGKVIVAVNSDSAFWEKIRNEVMPLYGGGKFKEEDDGGVVFVPHDASSLWNNRWKKVDIFYDPIGLNVKSTKYMVNKKSGERTFAEVVSDRTIPPGFVIKVL